MKKRNKTLKKLILLFLMTIISFSNLANANTEIDCLYANAVQEGGDKKENIIPVILITINRTKQHYLGAKTICQTVYKKGQFVWDKHNNKHIKFKEDFSLAKHLAIELYNDYYLNNKIPDGYNALHKALFFSKGKPVGETVIGKYGSHWIANEGGNYKKKHKHKHLQVAVATKNKKRKILA